MNACYCAILLTQHNLLTEAGILLRNQSFQRGQIRPVGFVDGFWPCESYATMVANKCNLLPSLAFIINRDEILYTIMSEFLESTALNNAFASFFNHFLPMFNEDTQFVVPEHGNDHILTSAMDLTFCERAVIHPRVEKPIKQDTPLNFVLFCQGNDLYSRVLKRLFKSRLCEQPDVPSTSSSAMNAMDLPQYTVKDLLRAPILNDNLMHSRTVALVSDSKFKAAAKVERGSICYKGGATSRRLAELLIHNGVNLASHRVVITCFGTCDAMNVAPSDWEESLEYMVDLLLPLVNDPNGTIVIINSGVGSTKWTHVPDYTKWMRLRLKLNLLDRSVHNFHFVDWSVPGPENALIDNNRNPIKLYMRDHHPNRLGLVVMLKRWIQICPELANVDFRFSDAYTDEKKGKWGYEAGQLSQPGD
jgi:hypothetical protein